MNNKNALRLLTAAGLLAASGVSQAAPIPVYNFNVEDSDGVPGNPAGGKITAIDTTYDANTGDFEWNYTVEGDHDGFWLVISDGDNPKAPNQSVEEYAILYGDLQRNRITAYAYNGENNSNSFIQGRFLESFGMPFSTTDATLPAAPGSVDPATQVTDVSFSINVAGLNADGIQPDWDGVAFGTHIGVWFHPAATNRNTRPLFNYRDENGNRVIDRFRPTSTGWYDTEDQQAHMVPEPGMLYLVGLGLLAFALSRGLMSGAIRRPSLRVQSHREILASAGPAYMTMSGPNRHLPIRTASP